MNSSPENDVTNGITSFDSDGYTLGDSAAFNGSGDSHVGWNWKANGTGVANTDGTISSTVSVNTTSGFSISVLALVQVLMLQLVMVYLLHLTMIFYKRRGC